MMQLISLALVSFLVSAGATRWLCRTGLGVVAMDYPNERSLHAVPIRRAGGLGMIAGALAAIFGLGVFFGKEVPGPVLWLGAAAALVAVVSYLDDLRQVPIGYRLLAHFIAGALLVAGGISVDTVTLPATRHGVPVVPAAVVTVLFVVWMTNLYNFMDGMDGFAGGMAVVGFATLAVLGGMSGAELFAVLNLIVAAAAGGFLVFNFPPARIFMGDTGSSTLGFLAAGMSLWGDASGVVPLWIALLVFAPFIVDATVTLLGRLVRREKVWRAHRTHYYQRLVQAGWGHRRTVLVEYGLMVICAGAALAARVVTAPVQWAILLAVGLLYVVFFALVRAAEARGRRDARGAP